MIIGLTGPICAGKDSLIKIFVEMGFERFSLSDELRELMKRDGIEITRKNMQDYGDMIRRKEGAGVISRRIISKLSLGKNYVIDSIRNPSEVYELKKLDGFVLLFINSETENRFNRLIARGREKDPKTFKDFLDLDARDKGVGQEEHAQQNAKCWKLADYEIDNDGSLIDLARKAEEFLLVLKQKA